MGLLRQLLRLPVTGPAQATIWVARQVHAAATQEWQDPALIRAELRRLEAALLAGEIDDATYDAAEADLLARLQAGGAT